MEKKDGKKENGFISGMDQINWLDEYEALLRDMRHELHRHPETAMNEIETSRYIAQQLSSIGIPYRMTGKTGVIADLAVKEELPYVAVRAEIDGLAVPEKTGLPFSSEKPGYMHACGHDANTAVLLCLAAVLAKHQEDLKCNVRFIFEPAEETGEGARYMIARGALENPKPSCILVFHFGNQETRAMEIQKSISTAAIGGLAIHVQGKASHFSQYKEGIDAMYGASRLVVAVREINDSFKTKYPFILGLGNLQAGVGRNTVAEQAVLEGSLRTFSEEDFESVYRELLKQARKIEKESGTHITVELTKKIPPIINDENLVRCGTEIGRGMFEDKFYLGEKPFLVGDNAAYYMEEVPGMRVVFLAGREGEEPYPVHHSKFDIDERVMMDAVKFLYSYLCSWI
ncbi:MAG: M20 family metallopeptidase [Lachnospiraceae bacterium]|nr:M20 family metallopeptidase [Lachnospiraceae bacterium]MDD7077300.1 M20 family metallopeptidase [Lachnospiraceae bacterium]MDY3729389.1 M20 family metallopeptidase [Candidatus Choladocola sp.]